MMQFAIPENKTISYASLKTGSRCVGTGLAPVPSHAGRLAPDGSKNQVIADFSSAIIMPISANMLGQILLSITAREGSRYTCVSCGIIFCLLVMAACRSQEDRKKEERIEYFSDGSIRSRATYVDGRKTGREEVFYSNGQIASISNYENDTLSGWREEYTNSGFMETRLHYEKGTPNGPFFDYYSNGNISTSGKFRNGLMYGRVFNYFENDSGKVESEEWISNAIGREFQYYIKYFDSQGNLLSEERDICVEKINPSLSEVSCSISLCHPEEFDSLKIVFGGFSYDFKPEGEVDTLAVSGERFYFVVPNEILTDSFIRAQIVGYQRPMKTDTFTVRSRTVFLMEEKIPKF